MNLDRTDRSGAKLSSSTTCVSRPGRREGCIIRINAGQLTLQTFTTAQHYLTHLLREKITTSQSRVVVVSSGAIRNLPDNDPSKSRTTLKVLLYYLTDRLATFITETLDVDLVANSGAESSVTYSASKYAQLLGAHYWRRQLGSSATVVAVSPGLIPGTGLGRYSGFNIPSNVPDAKSIQEGIYIAYFTPESVTFG